MTPRAHQGSAPAVGADWLAPHRDTFLAELRRDGFAPGTIQHYRYVIDAVRSAIYSLGLGAKTVNEPVLASIRTTATRDMTAERCRTWNFRLDRFIAYLVDAGVLAPPPAKPAAPDAMGQLHAEYESWLRHQRGLSEATIGRHLCFLKRFMTFRFGEVLGSLDDITSDDIITFLSQPTSGTRFRLNDTWPWQLRSLFKFLFWSGKTRRNLAISIPGVAGYRSTGLPRHLKPAEVRQLLEAVRTDDAIGRRNHAMLLLMVRLGLRAQEVTAIRLEDICWRAGELMVRGKGKLHDRMPLPVDVGEAIVAYIRGGRAGTSRYLFVCGRAPHRRFKAANVVNRVLHRAFEKTGLKPPCRNVGSYVLRHSLAVDLLGKGASLDEIGDLLRHRSRMTTTMYARYDIEALRSVALPWPQHGGLR